MKRIGQTNEGNYLVEMTRAEILAFDRLVLAVDGGSWDTFAIRDSGALLTTYFDMADTFDCIRAFRDALFRVNDLRDLVNQLELSVLKRGTP